jgi:hypothetical protein
VVVTFAIQQFQERLNTLATSGPKTFATLRVLESQEKMAADEIRDAELDLRSKEPEIQELRNEIEGYDKEALDLGARVVVAKDDDTQQRLAAQSAVLAGKRAIREKRLREIYERHRLAVDAHKGIQSQVTPTDRIALEKLRRLDEEQAQLQAYAKPFLLMPQELLTLILTLSMGIFGSTIAVSRSLYDPKSDVTPGPHWYLFRPIQGAVMALAVYFLFKAGVLILSAPPSSGVASRDLNPFVIAFLGIISGLFAEYAYQRLEVAAKGIFQPDVPRQGSAWATGVAQEIASQNKSHGALAAYLRQPPELVDKWISGQVPVPEEAQRAIAFWLGKPRDELFKDEAISD